MLEGVLAGALFTLYGAGAARAAGRFGWGRRCFGFWIEIGHEASFACGTFGRRSRNRLNDWCGGRRRKFEICHGRFLAGRGGGGFLVFYETNFGWVRF